MSKQQRFIPELFGALLLVGVISTSITGSDNSDKLGPIESLTIQGEGKELTLTNSDGRLSWGDQKTSTVWSVGFMEVGKALSQLMKAEHFGEAVSRWQQLLNTVPPGSPARAMVQKAMDRAVEGEQQQSDTVE